MDMAGIAELRPSPIAGRWYPGDAGLLARQVDHYLEEACLPELVGEVLAVVAPHAGHMYSGVTAGYAFRSVCGKSFPRVALLSPMHGYYPDALITSAHQGYETPLGSVWIDQEAMSSLNKSLKVRGMSVPSGVARDSEHSLEIELPFLQRALLGKFLLLPLMLRTQQTEDLRALGEALAETLSEFPALLVASTDLSHFYPLAAAERYDANMLDRISQLSPEGVLEAEENGTGMACGAGAVAAVLWAARALGANAVEILHHSTSADQTGDENSVVGYGAAVVLKRT
jgi:AmmeMemoRadiSam system protein B